MKQASNFPPTQSCLLLLLFVETKKNTNLTMNKSLLSVCVVLSVLLMAEAATPRPRPGTGVPPTISPIVQDPMGCPTLAPGYIAHCVNKCASGCPKEWICCSNGCGRYCYDPVHMIGNN